MGTELQPAHAILGASSSERWFNCPGSVNAIAKLPDKYLNLSSPEADEGTLAHEYLAKRCEGKIQEIYLKKMRCVRLSSMHGL